MNVNESINVSNEQNDQLLCHNSTKTMSNITTIATNSGGTLQQQSAQIYYNNSLAIRQEIQRFESVHPSIYAVYDLLELIHDPLVAQQCREHVVCIEDSFVNSQEWTLSRTVPDLRLGIIGSLSSGKSALVHRYLTGSYMQDESPEGGRFKKEVILDGQSYLLMIRDEGGPPEMQFSCWVDAVILVFSLENESSFNSIYNYYTKMFHYRNASDIPVILVGTQDAISETNPRVIDESKARKLSSDLKRCSYYETCATYGLNVEKVFQDACQKIVTSRMSSSTTGNNSRPNTPSIGYYRPHSSNNNITAAVTSSSSSSSHSSQSSTVTNGNNNLINNKTQPVITSPNHLAHQSHGVNRPLQSSLSSQSPQLKPIVPNNVLNQKPHDSGPIPPLRVESKHNELKVPPLGTLSETSVKDVSPKDTKDLPTPSSTPTTARKARRRSNLFTPLSNKKHEDKFKNGEVGSGRTIPVKQGYLYKKSVKTLNKDWKKKYVTLTTDGRLTYHPTLHDYMEDVHGKNIPLKHTTVKIPGQKPRGSRVSAPPVITTNPYGDISADLNSLAISGGNKYVNGDQRLIPNTNPKLDTPNVKKRHRRLKIHNNKNDDDSDGYEFIIVSLENKQWHFEANNGEEREDWVCAIEQQILSSLQSMESEKSKHRGNSCVDSTTIQAIKTVPGNTHCIDCDAPNPDWASLNLGALFCIECSGIHRNLGTHISKVRSLDLDDWTNGSISVMMGLGNTAANSIWEYNLKGRAKPTPNSSREEKERWIRAKYDQKDFLAPIVDTIRIEQQLIDAVIKSDVKQLSLVLAHLASNEQLNHAFYTRDAKTPLHLATVKGSLPIVQLLIWHNANVKAIDADGKTALYYAKTSGHKDVEELLKNSGCFDINGVNSNSNSSVSSSVSSSIGSSKRRGSLTALTPKSSEIFDKLPSSII